MLPSRARDESREILASELAEGRSICVTATSSSMGPKILPGDVLTIGPSSPERMRLGDILLVAIGGEWIVHRLLARRTAPEGVTCITRGDRSDLADPPVMQNAVLGIVTKSNRNGHETPISQQAPAMGIDEALLLASFPSPDVLTMESDVTRGFAWKTFGDAAVVEGLAPLIYFSNRPMMSGTTIPPERTAPLREAFFSSLARTTLFLEEFRAVAGLLLGLDFAPLKGVYLASRVYASPALRPFSDMDVLVRRTDFPEVARRLAQAGYRQEGDTVPSSEPPRFSDYLNSADFRKDSSGGASIHVHWHLLNTIKPFNIPASMDIEQVWRATRQSPEGWLELCPEHLLIHLCQHAMTHSFDRLILLRDIAEVIEKQGASLKWPCFVSDCREFGLSHPVYCALLTVARKTGAIVPGQVLAELAPARSCICTRIFMKLTARGVRYPELAVLAFFDNKASLINRTRIVWRLLFPPREVLAYAYGMKLQEIGARTYVSRLLRGLAQALRTVAR